MTDEVPQPAKAPLPPWFPGWPDARGWAMILMFILTVMILIMIRENPRLLGNASFMQLASTIAGAGGLGLVLAFHFGSSSGTAKANQRADKAEAKAEAATSGTGDGKP